MWAWMENFGNFTDQIIIYNLILSNILNFSIKIWQMIIELFSKIKCWQYVNKLRLKYSKLLKYLTKPESWNLVRCQHLCMETVGRSCKLQVFFLWILMNFLVLIIYKTITLLCSIFFIACILARYAFLTGYG